ncbi:MAG: tetratricopeptide repeat protein [bacterium]|nr:tetratricopeptide repeat protein [bacterium]
MGVVAAASLGLTTLAAQAVPHPPAPGGGTTTVWWLREGQRCLDREDPWQAWRAFQVAAATTPDPAGYIGLGHSHLLLGRAAFAHRYAEAARKLAKAVGGAIEQEAMALCVRALIRARAFDAAVRQSGAFVQEIGRPAADLLAARGSALFRVQRVDEAAKVYRRVTTLDPHHAEAHLRLGSGLTPPVVVEIDDHLRAAVIASRARLHERAIELLLDVLERDGANPVAHRLLGEALFQQRGATAMAATDPAFEELAAAMPTPNVRGIPVAEFVSGYDELAAERRRIVDRTAVLFGRYLPKLVAIGSRHNLLLELERTTDAPARQSLRGKRTFDGRVWDDVRGIGGMQAATGIESLDEAAQFGFDTIAHEVAHQVHFYAFTPLLRAKIKRLYKTALAANRCLDYYAATNEAEYFGQGVEAFVSFAKRPGGETTHGHTRFELYRVDRDLHDFVASVVDSDPLKNPAQRDRILAAAARVALRCGRPEDAKIAASWMAEGVERKRLARRAELALAAAASQ